MKTIKLFTIGTLVIGALVFFSCSRNSSSNNVDNSQAQVQIRLVDKPMPGVKEVWVDIQQVELIVNGGPPTMLTGAHPGVYNLMALTNGKDTLLADATIPPGTISQIRLILGDNNYLVNTAGEKIPLKTPSAQQSGLKVQVHQDVSGGILYRLVLDFDVAQSIVLAGNSGNVNLKPVLRLLSFMPSGGNIKGVVRPDSFATAVIALHGTDTIASTFSSVPGGNYLIKDIPANSYTLVFVPSDTSFKIQQKPASVTLGQVTVVDTVKLVH